MSHESFRDRFEKELRRRRYAENTVSAYIMWLDDLARFFPNEATDRLSRKQVADYIGTLITRRKYSPPTVNQAVHALHFFYSSTCDRDLDLKSIPRPASTRKIPDLLSPEDVREFLQSCEGHPQHLSFSLVYSLGLDVSEVIRLQTKDVDLQRQDIRVRNKSGRVYRTSPIADAVAAALKNHLKTIGRSKWLFPSRDGKTHTSESTLQKAFNRVLDRTPLDESTSLRSLKYAYIKHLEQQGIPLRTVLSTLGIQPKTSLDFYTQIDHVELPITWSPLDRIIYASNKRSVDISALWANTGTPNVRLDALLAYPLDSDGSLSWRQEKHAQTGAW